MDQSFGKLSLVQSTSVFDQFMGGCLVKDLSGLVDSSDFGVFVVPASFQGIEEGIDMWFPDIGLKVLPRYSLWFVSVVIGGCLVKFTWLCVYALLTSFLYFLFVVGIV